MELPGVGRFFGKIFDIEIPNIHSVNVQEEMYIEKRVAQLLAEILENVWRMLKFCENDYEILKKFSMELLRMFLGRLVNGLDEMVSDISARFPEISAKYSEISTKCYEIYVKSWHKIVEKDWYTVVVSLLSIVYHYLLGYVLKGGTGAYSSISLDVRDTSMSLLLFRDSYVRINFQNVPPSREKKSASTSFEFNYLLLGGYDSQRDEEIVYQIAAIYYVKDEAHIKLSNGSYFTISLMPEQKQGLSGLVKERCVAARAKEISKEFQVQNKAMVMPSETSPIGDNGFFQPVACEKFGSELLWEAADVQPGDLEIVDLNLCSCLPSLPRGISLLSSLVSLPSLATSVESLSSLSSISSLSTLLLISSISTLSSLSSLSLLPTSLGSLLPTSLGSLLKLATVTVDDLLQYLLGYVFKAYSAGSLDFRDTFVSVLLFQGSYVWIKFRDVAPKRSVYRRPKKDEVGRVTYHGKYEPRFKPPREKLLGGTSFKFDHLPLGGYDSELDAKIVCQIAGFYYVKDEGRIQLRDGSHFTIPAVPEQEQSLSGKEKAQWVTARAKEVFRDFQLMNNVLNLPSESNTVGVHDFLDQHVACEEFSLDALWEAADAHPVDWEFADNLCLVGEGLEGTSISPSEAEQVVLRIERPQSLDIVSNDADSMTMQESSTQQLKEHLEAKFKRRISEQHEQYLKLEKQLDERILQLRLENEERISQLQLEIEYLRSRLY